MVAFGRDGGLAPGCCSSLRWAWPRPPATASRASTTTRPSVANSRPCSAGLRPPPTSRALEWQAVAEGRLSPELAQERREVDDAMAGLLPQLVLRDHGSAKIRAVRDAFAVYDAAVDQQFELLAEGSSPRPRRWTSSGSIRPLLAWPRRSPWPAGTTAPLPARRTGGPILAPCCCWWWRPRSSRCCVAVPAGQVAGGRAVRPPGAPRPADRAAQPHAAGRAAPGRAGPRGPAQGAGVLAVAGPGRLQGRQRQPRPSGRRPAAAGGRGAPARLPAPRRHPGPHGG